MDRIRIPQDVRFSTSSKGDQSKWLIDDMWVKENTRGYEGIAEYTVSLILESSSLTSSQFISYTPCLIEKHDGKVKEGCYSKDFRGALQEVTLERLFESNFETTDEVLTNNRYATRDRFDWMMDKIYQFTGLDVTNEIAQMLALDAFILNEDRHTNNILFLYDPKSEAWQLAPIFDNGLSLLSDMIDYPLSIPVSILKRKVKENPSVHPFQNSFLYTRGSLLFIARC